MTRTIILTAALGALTITTAGCNTVQGMGRDIESVGRKGEEVISYAPADASERDVQVAR